MKKESTFIEEINEIPQTVEYSSNRRLVNGLQSRLSNGFLSFIYTIPSVLGIIGGLNVLFQYFIGDDVIVHEVHMERRRTFLSDLFGSEFYFYKDK